MKLNLYSKFLISLVVLVTLSLSSMGYVLLRDADQRLATFQYLQAESQTRTLAESSKNALLEDDYPLIEDLVNVAISEEYYQYAAIVDPTGLVLSHTDLNEVGKIVSIKNTLQEITHRDLFLQGQRIREISYPIYVEGIYLATARVAYYLDKQVNLGRETVTWIVNILLFTLISMSLGGMFISRRLTRPIIELTNIVNENYSGHRLEIHPDIISRSDEVGSLARAFNHMSGQLLERLEELQYQITQRELASAKDQIKSKFLANISHELRTPLNAIIGYGELLSEILGEEQLVEYAADANKITHSAKHLTLLINDMLDLSKIEAGKVTIEHEFFDIKNFMADIEMTVTPLLKNNNNKMSTHYKLQSDMLESDQLRLKQVLINLVSNAAKFTKNGEITIEVIIDSEFAKFNVIDTGMGMSESELDIIFDPFAQAELNITKNYGGTGLGLSISRRICHMLDGDVSVTSGIDVGTTFSVVLPIRTAFDRALENCA